MKEALSQKKNLSHQILFFPEETPIPSPALTDTNTSEFSKLKAEIDLIKKYIESLNVEIEAIKIFMKNQFCLLKNSNSEQNVCVSAENKKVIETSSSAKQKLNTRKCFEKHNN